MSEKLVFLERFDWDAFAGAENFAGGDEPFMVEASMRVGEDVKPVLVVADGTGIDFILESSTDDLGAMPFGETISLSLRIEPSTSDGGGSLITREFALALVEGLALRTQALGEEAGFSKDLLLRSGFVSIS